MIKINEHHYTKSTRLFCPLLQFTNRIQLASGDWGCCTGSKIDKNKIMTAAHCMSKPWKQARYSNRRFSTLNDKEG